ncbi:MAG TPA: hypothetical protein VNB22_07000 [Pyrinomonadaceae bacterium]|jgi:hypothetical protein|nr:hypothetical protein [Pyrinomonadaceae bacterium]
MRNKSTKRLLILSCSARKTSDEQCAALDRYLSPAFYVVRRFLKNNPQNDVVIWIVSAKYGLIGANRLIEHYDQAMTPARAGELAGRIAEQFEDLNRAHFLQRAPVSVFCHLPKTYADALASQLNIFRKYSSVEAAQGRPGEKLQQLKNWLEKGEK